MESVFSAAFRIRSKKSLNSISDRKANLSRLRSVLRPPENTLVDCFSAAERAFFGFSKALAQLLLPALKADRSDEICGTKKAPHQSADLKK
ncbi:hypothetical protein LJU32_13040 [Pseudomonas sp. B21_DOA]|nr:hypothetical protein LJU32_13040 [Pseudomonas sp. B21_DOA]